jgi:hypothetical protein
MSKNFFIKNICLIRDDGERRKGERTMRDIIAPALSHFSFLISKRVILTERLHALFKYGIEFVTHAAGASTNARLERTCGVEVDA